MPHFNPKEKTMLRESEMKRTAKLMQALIKGRGDRILLGGRHGELRSTEIDRPLSLDDFIGHLSQIDCLGIYPLLDNQRSWFAVIDFDNKVDSPNPNCRSDAKRVASRLKALGLSFLAEISQSGRGVHLWLFFKKPVRARLIRAVLLQVLHELELDGTEVFPKQDRLSASCKYGNAIRLPLFAKSRFADPFCGWGRIPAVTALRGVRRITEAQLHRVAKKLGVFHAQHEAASGSPDSIGILSPHLQFLLSRPSTTLVQRWSGNSVGLQDPSKSGIAMAIATCLVRSFVPTDEIKTAIAHWLRSNKSRKADDPAWITRTVEKAYHFVQQSYRTRLPVTAASPSPAIAREYNRLLRNRS